MTYSLGIDLGGSSIKVAAVTAEGQVLHQDQVDFESGQPMEWAEKIRVTARQIPSLIGSEPQSIGLSAPGLAARDGRFIAHMPGRLQGLEGLVWADYLERPEGVPVLNDAQAALLGEAWLGAARRFRHVILLTLGTGVGGAIMADGRLWTGHTGRGGHFGHTCLDPAGRPDICNTPGSLENAIGNCTILERTEGRFFDTHALIRAHRTGDAFATAIWLKSIRALAAAIASFVNVIDPEAVIVGGGIAAAGDALFDPLRQFLDEFEWRPGGRQVQVLRATLGEFAGAIGAARNAVAPGC